LPVYQSVLKLFQNPMYAGAYAFGRTQSKTSVVNGRSRKTDGHRRSTAEWHVLIRDHHPGYISWEQYERNQAVIAANAHMKSRMEPKAGRGGRALLAGILRCRRCGRMLHVAYTGIQTTAVRYHCKGAHINHGTEWCISFGGLRVDEAVAKAVLSAIGGNAVEAALGAAEQMRQQRQRQRKSLELELEQAEYEVRLSSRRYEAVDPDNRLVASELEVRWNNALGKVNQLRAKLEAFDLGNTSMAVPGKEVLLSLAQDLPAVWNVPSTDRRLKQRIIRILVHEIVADVSEESNEIVLLIHWAGGSHSELRVKKNAPGKHSRCTSTEAIEVIRQMAGRFPDEQIAATLNRLGFSTGAGNTWTEQSVYSARHYHEMPAYDASRSSNDVLTMAEAAQRLGVSTTSVRRLIEQKKPTASQVVACAPWQIPIAALDSPDVQTAVDIIKRGARIPQTRNDDDRESLFSTD